MKLPIIKNINEFIEQNDEDFVLEALEVLESISQVKSLKDEEVLVIGELMSNMYGALEVQKEIRNGKTQKEAMNDFMQRVLGSIDK